ncbi:hypothetical protein [Haloarcula amylovorans]|uniref:hypothetical protein n=1 Tax=Haloarcula amylovorans TaxID=2562280 RepID=UPI0010766BC1|nr:hypothetical protein [Halomicroarcula amylolytica]
MSQEPDGEDPTVSQKVEPTPASEGITQHLRGIWNGIREVYEIHRLKIGIFGTISTVLFQILFADEIERILPAIVGDVSNFLTSNTGLAILATVIIALQAWALRLIRAVGSEVESTDRLRPDGGDKNLPPRDSKGRFKSTGSGPSIIFVVAVVMMGYLLGSQYGETEAILGGVAAFLLLIWTDNL